MFIHFFLIVVGLNVQLDYFETILNPYFTYEARESLKTLQGVLLEKATECAAEATETPTHNRRPTRGSDDLLDDRHQGMTVSPDDLIVSNTCSLSSFIFRILFRMLFAHLLIVCKFHVVCSAIKIIFVTEYCLSFLNSPCKFAALTGYNAISHQIV